MSARRVWVVTLTIAMGCRSTAEVAPRSNRDVSTSPVPRAEASVTVMPVPRRGIADGLTSFQSEVACTQDSDCTVAALPTCSPCGSCPRILDARAPIPSLRCPAERTGPKGGPREAPTCSPCPSAPEYVVCVDGFCAGGREPRELSISHECQADSDCVAAWVGGCCSCPNVVVALSRTALAAVERTCANAPCSATRARSNRGYGPACDAPRCLEDTSLVAVCAESSAKKRVCSLRSPDKTPSR